MERTKPLGAGNPDNANLTLENIVRQSLDTDPGLSAANITVSADVTRNAVTLSGFVGSEELRRRAVQLAREAQAGISVDDRLQVRPGTSRKGNGNRHYA